MAVLRVLGIYSMDKLKRTDWENVGRYRAKKGSDYVRRYGRDISTSPYKLTPSRCKLGKSSGGFYYDPMTFDAITTQTTSISPIPDPQDQDVGVADEVLCHCHFC